MHLTEKDMIGENMWEKIKIFFIGVGVAILIAVFYILKKESIARKLQALLLEKYNKENQQLQNKSEKLNTKLVDNKIVAEKYVEKIEKLNKKKEQIDEKTNSLSNDDLVSAIDDWFKSR